MVGPGARASAGASQPWRVGHAGHVLDLLFVSVDGAHAHAHAVVWLPPSGG